MNEEMPEEGMLGKDPQGALAETVTRPRTRYIRADLTYPRHLVDELIEASDKIKGRYCRLADKATAGLSPAQQRLVDSFDELIIALKDENNE